MKKTILIGACMALTVGILFTSCVPTRKLVASQARVGELQQDSIEAVNQLKECNVVVDNLKVQNAKAQDEYAMVRNDLKSLTAASNMTISDQAKRLKTLQNIIKSQQDIMAKLKNSIADALMNYNADELSVYTKDGNVYVSLAEKLLFKSGSDVVDPKGIEAVKTLAQVLNSTTNIKVLIEGHTDNIPIKTAKFKDNWDLSTARANSIVRLLTIDNGFDSKRITASGKGQFHPIKTNDTPEGRASNRRTEVILSPDLHEIYTLLYQ